VLLNTSSKSILSASRSDDGKRDKYHTPPVEAVHPPVCAEQLAIVANDIVERFTGTSDELEKSLGMLMLDGYMGWKVITIIHNKRTVRKYEEILGISVREVFPKEEPIALRSLGDNIPIELGNYWKVDTGNVAIEVRRELADPNGIQKG